MITSTGCVAVVEAKPVNNAHPVCKAKLSSGKAVSAARWRLALSYVAHWEAVSTAARIIPGVAPRQRPRTPSSATTWRTIRVRRERLLGGVGVGAVEEDTARRPEEDDDDEAEQDMPARPAGIGVWVWCTGGRGGAGGWGGREVVAVVVVAVGLAAAAAATTTAVAGSACMRTLTSSVGDVIAAAKAPEAAPEASLMPNEAFWGDEEEDDAPDADAEEEEAAASASRMGP